MIARAGDEARHSAESADLTVTRIVICMHPVTKAIMDAVDAYMPEDGWNQWYVDEFSVDCDAREFWAVVDRAVSMAVNSGDHSDSASEQ